jgi:hypothetical protein
VRKKKKREREREKDSSEKRGGEERRIGRGEEDH